MHNKQFKRLNDFDNDRFEVDREDVENATAIFRIVRVVAIYQGSDAIEIVLESISASRKGLPLNQPCVHLKKEKNSIRSQQSKSNAAHRDKRVRSTYCV